MQSHQNADKRSVLLLPVLVLLCVALLAGCTIVGPASVRSGRLAYNEAIIETDNQQMLLLAVRGRYGERSNLLAVKSVTANMKVRANASTQLGFGDSDNYSGNLVPFGAGVIYEENPTISYVPVGGGAYVRQLMSPISITFLAQLTQNLSDPAPVYYALVSKINGIENPDFQPSGRSPDGRFVLVIELLSELTRAQKLAWVQDSNRDNGFSLIFEDFQRDHAASVFELFQLLGMAPPENASDRVVVPVSVALRNPQTGGIGIMTRSIFDLLEIFTAAVEVPASHLSRGVAVSYPQAGLIGSQVRVNYSEERPETAYVAVPYRDGWYYIEDSDQTTKQYFTLMSLLMSTTVADTTDRNAAPVLTVPVSR